MFQRQQTGQSESQEGTGPGLLFRVQSSAGFFAVGVIELIEESGADHLLLPGDRNRTHAKLLEELLIVGVKLDALDVREFGDVTRVLGIDDIRFGDPRRSDKPRLQAWEVDRFEPIVFPGVVASAKRNMKFR